jgi:hypothetical protein
VGLLIWGALSDERTGLSVTIAAGPRHRSHFRVPVPWDSWPYFTLSDMRLPFSSPPARRATVEVFDTASIRGNWLDSSQSQSQSHIATDDQSISKSWCLAPSGAHDQIFITLWQLLSWFVGAPSLTRGRVCLLYMLLALVSVVFLGFESLGTRYHFYFLRSDTSLFVASYDSQGHGGGIRPCLRVAD